MKDNEIRWVQRFSNFSKALDKLEEAIIQIRAQFSLNSSVRQHPDPFLDDIIKEGLIQRFEYTHELAWNVMKDFLIHAGNNSVYGSKDATRAFFQLGLIDDGEIWMDMIQSRNKTSHTYNELVADEIVTRIENNYLSAFLDFKEQMSNLAGK